MTEQLEKFMADQRKKLAEGTSYYMIYDKLYPMTTYMSFKDVVGMAEDFVGSLEEYGFGTLGLQPVREQEFIQAAKEALEREYGLCMIFHPEDVGEFVWYASEYGIEEQAIKLVAKHNPWFAKMEYGV